MAEDQMASGKRAWGAVAPRRRRPVGGAALLAALGAVVGASSRQGLSQEMLGGVLPAGAGAEILQVHNRERAAVGVAPLAWDPALAATALECAKALAASRQFRHCRSGENLWMGSTGSFSPTQMAELWAAERRDFQAGTFPAVSRSGN